MRKTFGKLGAVPEERRQAKVRANYKNKGAIDSCDNYRPINLPCVAQKMLANLLLKRLQDAGSEDRLTSTQCCFRRGRGTSDSIHEVRRSIELDRAAQNGAVAFVALDWKKAFDSIKVDAMLHALRGL